MVYIIIGSFASGSGPDGTTVLPKPPNDSQPAAIVAISHMCRVEPIDLNEICRMLAMSADLRAAIDSVLSRGYAATIPISYASTFLI
jgi:hypothetical protein